MTFTNSILSVALNQSIKSAQRFYNYLRTNLDLVETMMTGVRMFRGIKIIHQEIELDIDDEPIEI
jgi:hypothetical protein